MDATALGVKTLCSQSKATLECVETQNNSAGDTQFLLTDGRDFHLTVAWLLVFVAVCTVFTNGLVIELMVKYQWLRNHTNYMILSMCVMGIIDGFVFLPIKATQVIAQVSSQAVCEILSISDFVIVMMTVLHLLAINIQRYHAVKNPLNCHRLSIPWITVVNICLVWGISIACGILLEHLFGNYATAGRYCIAIPSSETADVVLTVLCFWLPFTIACTAYIHIYVIVQRQKRFMEANSRQQYRPQDGVNRVIFLVLGSTFLAFAPFSTFVVLLHHLDESAQKTGIIYVLPPCGLLLHLGTALNPLVYALCSLNFRKAVQMMLCGRTASETRRSQSNAITHISLHGVGV